MRAILAAGTDATARRSRPGSPRAAATWATATPWLPPDAATTPAAGTSAASTRLNAPRGLNEPACCSSSSLRVSGPATEGAGFEGQDRRAAHMTGDAARRPRRRRSRVTVRHASRHTWARRGDGTAVAGAATADTSASPSAVTDVDVVAAVRWRRGTPPRRAAAPAGRGAGAAPPRRPPSRRRCSCGRITSKSVNSQRPRATVATGGRVGVCEREPGRCGRRRRRRRARRTAAGGASGARSRSTCTHKLTASTGRPRSPAHRDPPLGPPRRPYRCRTSAGRAPRRRPGAARPRRAVRRTTQPSSSRPASRVSSLETSCR